MGPHLGYTIEKTNGGALMNNFQKSKYVISIMMAIVKDLPLIFCGIVSLTILDGLLTPVMVLVVAGFIDTALLVASSQLSQSTLLLYGMLVIAGYIYTALSQQFTALLYKSAEDVLIKKLKPRMVKKVYAIEYFLYERSETQDLIHRVCDDSPKKFTSTLQTLMSLVRIAVQVGGIIYALAPYLGWWVLAILSALLPLLLVTSKGGKKVYAAEKEVAIITRKMNYLSDILSNRDSGHERTLFGFTGQMNEKFKQAHLFRSNYNTKALVKEVSRSKIVNIFINLMIIPLIWVLAKSVSTQTLSVGLFTSIIGSVMVLSKILSGQLSELFLNLASHNEYAKDLYAFAHLAENEDVHSDVVAPIFETLTIKNLYFRYKEEGDYILKGINLDIKCGRSYSLVGINGAGKTTLTKILTGLYRNYEGEILLNGVDIKNYSYGQLRQVFSVVSQDFARYGISVKENIVFEKKDSDIGDLVHSLEMDQFINGLPQKENTLLGKIEKDGVDLSGGQWQKLAIARALFRNTPFVILDEPTSSLSPTAESDIYTKFMNFAEQRSLLMISHRLGSTKIADEIIVMDDGVIAECGSHGTLMANNQLYAKLFRKQSRLYHDEDQNTA